MSNPSQWETVGVGMANDLNERAFIDSVRYCVAGGLASYLTVYLYDDYTPEFQRAMRDALPPGLRFTWHGGGDFEVPHAADSVERNWERIQFVQETWAPLWATEDLIVTNFARTRPQGHPSFVPLFLTEECLAVSIEKTKRIQSRVPFPFVPEVPPFDLPVPDTMGINTFFRRYTEATDCYLNIDIGHYFSYNTLAGRDPMDGIEDFPLDRIVEINAGGGMYGDAAHRIWLDDHSGPMHPMILEALTHIVPRCPNLKAVYAEAIACEPWVLKHNLEKLNQIFWDGVRS